MAGGALGHDVVTAASEAEDNGGAHGNGGGDVAEGKVIDGWW
jgi:hypothetical protein